MKKQKYDIIKEETKVDTTGYVNVIIDEITPCLRDNETGELVDTEVIRIKRPSFLQKYNKKNGWYVNWAELSKETEIYALVLKGTVNIQGLISLQADNEVNAVYMAWVCSAPENNPQKTDTPKFSGVGGHLFAIAAKRSFDFGFGGDIYGFAASERLLKHYITVLGANAIRRFHKYHFIVVDDAVNEIMEVYNYDWTDEEL